MIPFHIHAIIRMTIATTTLDKRTRLPSSLHIHLHTIPHTPKKPCFFYLFSLKQTQFSECFFIITLRHETNYPFIKIIIKKWICLILKFLPPGKKS